MTARKSTRSAAGAEARRSGKKAEALLRRELDEAMQRGVARVFPLERGCDFVGIFDGIPVLLEIKSGSGRLTDGQREDMKAWFRCGGRAILLHLNDGLWIASEWGDSCFIAKTLPQKSGMRAFRNLLCYTWLA